LKERIERNDTVVKENERTIKKNGISTAEILKNVIDITNRGEIDTVGNTPLISSLSQPHSEGNKSALSVRCFKHCEDRVKVSRAPA
jgi:hypothetical protein